ncbi:MAG: T9SS type A sorting domain-containing protein [candidate division Zixibacteria bacterium]|nr:T9SS type A sorting domain-containing protein [candidate division Zixibacteria bacterium]
MLIRIIGLIIVLTLSASAGQTTLYIPQQSDGEIVTHSIEIPPKPEALRSMTSQKNLLGLERDKPFGLPKSKSGLPMTADTQADTLNVLVLRVEFRTEDPDDGTTTGNGNFDLRTLEEFRDSSNHEFDPAPHNKSYFSAHMEALNRYWWYVSDFQIRLNWDIYPEGESDAYRLDSLMSYYGSDGPWEQPVERLLNFFKDATALADTTSPEIDFSRYQSIIIFHAGSDQQNNIAFINDTPNDFWTGFLWTEDTVFVDDGAVAVNEVIIMPETASQDNRTTTLNGVMAHEFGHQLGLVDLYNTSNFLTQVGNFSLMDNNCMNIALELDESGTLVNGALPCYPDAWSRAYLGLSGVRELTSGADVVITAAEQRYTSTEVIKVPISEMEYFLIENRQTESDFDYLNPTVPVIPYAIIADSATGVIMGPGWGYYGNNELVKVASGEYDRLLPGNGVLIWHVNEVVAYLDYTLSGFNNFHLNALQWDRNRRFLSLVEADGIIDFGGNYFVGYGTDDEYFNMRGKREFTPSTNPATESSLGANTHISITDIANIERDDHTRNSELDCDTIMTCDIATEWSMAGFPTFGFPDVGYNGGGLLALDIDADGFSEILTARSMFLLAVNHDGSPATDTSSGLIIPSFDGDTLLYILPKFAELDTIDGYDYIDSDVIAGDFDGDSNPEIACFDTTGRLYLFEGVDQNPVDSLADLMETLTLSSTLVFGPVTYDFENDGRDELIAGFADSTLKLISYAGAGDITVDNLGAFPGLIFGIAIANDTLFVMSGGSGGNYLHLGEIEAGSLSEISEIQLPEGGLIGLACGDIDRDSTCDAVITVGDYLCIYDGGTQAMKYVPIEAPGQPALGDIDADGYPDIVLAAGYDYFKAYAFNHLGVIFNHYPVTLSRKYPSANGAGQPLLGDIDGDEMPDIIMALPNGTLDWTIAIIGEDDQIIDTTYGLTTGGLTCINFRGDILGGFPLPTSSEINVEPVIGDFDNDGDIDIAAIDSAGFIYAWDLESSANPIDLPWPTAGGDYRRQGFLSPDFQKPVNVADGFLAAGSVYNYPNPASNSTTFRYYVDRPADINIKIFDMTGEMVDELTGSTLGQVDDEVPWDCSEFASGVYFARFEASSQNANKNQLIKVALIK